MTPEDYMRRAIQLAHKGEGHVSPNPLVGCVIVKDGKIISEACHEHIGQFHAERNALLRCKEDPAGADLYVTLEPCCHYGRTPPCTEIILEKKIKRVYIGAMDVNPLVAGKGAKILEDAGVEVHTGVCEKEAHQLAEVFFHYMSTKTPFVVMKYAMSLDGKIACASGDSQWITGEESRRYVHELRKKYTGIMVGIGTVLADDPMLNCRIEQGVDPIRIVCDSHLRLPLDSQLVKTSKDIPVIDVCTFDELQTQEGLDKRAALEDAGVEVMAVGHGEVDLKKLMSTLAVEREIDSILIEGGGTLNAAALKAGIVQKIVAFVGGKVIGGADAKSPIEGEGAKTMAEVPELTDITVQRFGNDVCITGYLPKEAK